MKLLNAPILKKCFSYFFIFLLLVQCVGCKYYKTVNIDSDFKSTVEDIGKLSKYFLIHDGNLTYSLTDIEVDSTYIYGSLKLVNDNIYFDGKESYRYHKDEKEILNEVHFFLNPDAANLKPVSASIPISDLAEIRIIEKDTGKTVASYLASTIAVGLALYGILIIIVLLTKSSCPYVYVNDGAGYVFEGETFGGAIAQNLERDDYMPLPSINGNNGMYRLRISNELKERQYTDLAELMVIDHVTEQKVLLDKYGIPHSVVNLQAPTKATSFDGSNLQSKLIEKDREVFFFDNLSTSINEVNLKFEKPVNATNGKLVFNGKNTLWFDYMFGEFLKKFGNQFDTWTDHQAKVPSAERKEKNLEHNFPLSIFIMKNNEWQLVDYINTVGPLANRDFIVPINLSDIPGDEVEIKFETGFMFWEIDFAAMDFSENVELDITILKPASARGTGSQDWTSTLSESDGIYMAQENVGDVTEISYKIPTGIQHKMKTAFLHTRGYYELIREFEGLPQVAALKRFKEPGHFSDYSRAGYLKTINKEEGYITHFTSN